jgi:hypothetical protein
MAEVVLGLPVLRRGSHDRQAPAIQLQHMLNYVSGKFYAWRERVFGPKAEEVVKSFQANENLWWTGFVG